MKRRRVRGVTAVEAALVFPLLLLLTFGLIEYGWLFGKMQQTTNAARQGARVAILPSSTNSTVLASVSDIMTIGGMEASGYTVTITPADVSLPSAGEAIKVEVSVPYDSISLMRLPFLPVPENLKASVSMSKEGP